MICAWHAPHLLLQHDIQGLRALPAGQQPELHVVCHAEAQRLHSNRSRQDGTAMSV